jgi:hypothetical protein
MTQHRISIVEEQISVTLPTESVRILSAQPFLEFQEPVQEPYPMSVDCASRLSQGLDRMIEAATLSRPQFIIFPEFSVPGVSGVERLRDFLLSNEIAGPTVVIGGVTSLSLTAYASLMALPDVEVNVYPTNAPAVIPSDNWINTSVTLIKADDGKVAMWLQPKLSPSWPESQGIHQSMFRGQALHLFRGRFQTGLPCHFFSALCYDWIGVECGRTAPIALLDAFNDRCSTNGGPQFVNWVFVLQHNQRPNDDTFLAAARDFLIDTAYPFVQRQDAAIVMACTASSQMPGRNGTYGCSSVILAPTAPFDMRSCPSTFTTNGERIRKCATLRTCKDVVFREMGECCHIFDIRNPRGVRPDATDRTLPLENARVLAFTRGGTDPRIPDAPVPAVVKWLNDELDQLSDLASSLLTGCALHGNVMASQHTVTATHRRLPSQAAAERVHYSKATAAATKTAIDPAAFVDDWDQEEREGLEHVIHSLAIVGTVEPIEIEAASIHGRHTDKGVEIAVIRGDKHSDCINAFDKWSEKTHAPLLLISRDRHNTTPLERELERFDDPAGSSGMKCLDAQTLISKARSCTQIQLEAFTAELFDVTERRII